MGVTQQQPFYHYPSWFWGDWAWRGSLSSRCSQMAGGGDVLKASSLRCLLLGLGRFQQLGAGTAGLLLFLCGLSTWSLQHDDFGTAGSLPWPLRVPKVAVLQERARWKVYGLLSSSLGNHQASASLLVTFRTLC